MKKTLFFSFVIVSVLVGFINIQTTFAKTEKNTNGELLALQISPLRTILKSAKAQVRNPQNPLTPAVASKLASLMSSNNPDGFIKEVRNFLKKAPKLRANLLDSYAVPFDYILGMISRYRIEYPETNTAMSRLSDAIRAQGKQIYFDIRDSKFGNFSQNNIITYEPGEKLTIYLDTNLNSFDYAIVNFPKELKIKESKIKLIDGRASITFTIPSVQNEGPYTITFKTPSYPIIKKEFQFKVIKSGVVVNSPADLRIDDQPIGGYSYTKVISSDAGNISIGDTQKEVAKFRFTQNNSQEGVLLEKLTVYVSGTIEPTINLKNWKLYGQDGTLLASVEKSFGRYVNFVLPAAYFLNKGDIRDFSVKVDVVSGVGKYFFLYIMNNSDIKARGDVSGGYIVPTDSSGGTLTYTDTINATTGYFKIKSQAALSPQLIVTKSSSFGNTSYTSGSNNVKIAEFILQASNSDDINVNIISLNLFGTTTNIQNLRIKKSDGTQLGSAIGSPSATGNTFTISGFTIKKSESVALGIYGDIASGASANATTSIMISYAGISGTGVNSSIAVSAPQNFIVGQTITINSPTLTISKDANSPVSKIIINGQTGVEVGKIKLEAKNADIRLRKITLRADLPSSSPWTSDVAASNISKVYLYDGVKLLNSGGAFFVTTRVTEPLELGHDDIRIVSRYIPLATISGIDVIIPQSGSKVLTVKIDSADAANSKPNVISNIGVFGTNTTDLEAYAPSLITTGITLTGNASSSYMLFTNSAPVVVSAMASGAGSVSTAAPIGKYTITNAGTRDITISRIDVNLSISGATTSKSALQNVALWESTDEGTAIATTNVGSDGSGITSATTTSGAISTSIFFTSFTQKNVISAGASKTYIIVADTTAIESLLSNPGQNTAIVSTYINGAKGYNANNPLGWNDGKVTYSYTGTGQNTGKTYSNLKASDSGVVYGATLQY